MNILGDINSLLNEICPKYSFIRSGWKIAQWMKNRAVDENFRSGWKNALRMKNILWMKFWSNNFSSLAPYFNSFTAHILLQNDQNEAPFFALYLEMLRVCFKQCMFRVHECFGNVPFYPIVFFWCLSSCYCSNWDMLPYQ